MEIPFRNRVIQGTPLPSTWRDLVVLAGILSMFLIAFFPKLSQFSNDNLNEFSVDGQIMPVFCPLSPALVLEKTLKSIHCVNTSDLLTKIGITVYALAIFKGLLPSLFPVPSQGNSWQQVASFLMPRHKNLDTVDGFCSPSWWVLTSRKGQNKNWRIKSGAVLLWSPVL